MNYTKIENGNLYLSQKDYSFSWWLLVLTIVLLFIPVVDIFAICYLLPKFIFDNNVRKRRTMYYEAICEGNYSAINGGHTQNYNVIVNQKEPNVTPQTLYTYPNRFYQLVLISIGTLLLQVFVSNFIGFIGLFMVGYLAIQYADEYAQTLVSEELINNPSLIIHFPDGYKATIQTNPNIETVKGDCLDED